MDLPSAELARKNDSSGVKKNLPAAGTASCSGCRSGRKYDPARSIGVQVVARAHSKSTQTSLPDTAKSEKRSRSNKAYLCQVCSRGFTSKCGLAKHSRTIHGGIKTHECTLCDYPFRDRSDLHRHQLSVHSNESKLDSE
ncbi:zinc finger protein Xfin-like isoform X2 [Ornithodoros turicata]|uniref:zinc finger protein Xfin-like isoform X2 n=1 Tax=Ornithodoros turicata TaxID=34597 RepID=UPI003138EDCF